MDLGEERGELVCSGGEAGGGMACEDYELAGVSFGVRGGKEWILGGDVRAC